MSLSEFVTFIFYLLIVGAVFAILWWVVNWVAREFEFPAPITKVLRAVLVVAAAIVAIGVLLSMVGVMPQFRIR